MTDIMTFVTTVENEERHIAEKLLQLRTSLGIPLEQLAAILGIHPTELMQYEHAIIPISASLLVLAAIALGVEYDYFYQESTSPLPHLHPEKDYYTPAPQLV